MSTPETSDALVPQPVIPPVTPSAAPDGAAPEPAKRSRTPWIIGGIVLGALLLAGAAVVAFLLLTPTAGRGPEQAVLDYDRAYAEADCDLYFAITTPAFQEALATTCEEFEAEAQAFVDSFSDYEVVIDSTELSGATATVTTTESWVLEGEQNSAEYVYTLLAEGGTWRIDTLG